MNSEYKLLQARIIRAKNFFPKFVVELKNSISRHGMMNVELVRRYQRGSFIGSCFVWSDTEEGREVWKARYDEVSREVAYIEYEF